MSAWIAVNSGEGDPAWNMAVDEALLKRIENIGKPVLRFYSWNTPAATFGYFQKFKNVERTTQLRPLIRRPTAGGIVPHDDDWTYSLTVPLADPWHALNARESYHRIHLWIAQSFEQLGLDTELAPDCNDGAGSCFAGFEVSDVLLDGRKVAGAAQRRTRSGLLIQGSVQSTTEFPSRSDWEQTMLGIGTNELGECQTGSLTSISGVMEAADKLVLSKYANPEFIRKR